MARIWNQTKLWILLSAALALLLMIRSIPAGAEFFGFIAMWLLLFEILLFVTSSQPESRQILNLLFILTAFGIAVQCLMNQEQLLAASLTFRMASYSLSLIAAVLISSMIRFLIKKLPVRSAEIIWFAIHFALLIFISIFGTWEYGTLKHVVLFGKPIQITVFTKLTAVLFMAAVMNDRATSENSKIMVTIGFTVLNAAWFLYMKELGTFMIIAVLHLVMIIRFIRPICSLKRQYLLILGAGAAAAAFLIIAVLPVSGIHSAFLEKLQNRMLGAYDPSQLDPDGAGYSVNAARKAILIGGAFGSSLNLHIPEANTDLAFSYVFLRFGIGAAFLVMLIYCIFLSSMLHSASEKTQESETAAYGCAMVLFIQVFYSIAMCLGLLPICGINLTFISAGTMDMLVGFIMTFLVINSKVRRKRHV